MIHHQDPAEWGAASEEVDYAAHVDTLDDQWREIIAENWPGKKPTPGAIAAVLGMVHKCLALVDDGGSRGDAEIVSRILGAVTRSNNAGLAAEALRFVFNLSPESQTSIAERHNVTRAAVSRVCVQLAVEFGLPPGRGMKSEEAREVYRERAFEVHANNPRPTEHSECVSDEWAQVIDAMFDKPADGDEQHDHHQSREAA